MSSYSDQGAKVRDLGGVKAPAQDRGGEKILKEASKATTGIVGMKGIGKNGEPIK